jgi:hypothetical protein
MYNQPAFSIKDLRRLRERIFQTSDGKHQMAKVEGRRAFITEHVDTMRHLVGWPEHNAGHPTTLVELYVNRELYWWMRFPPYDVPTQFVRIDMLDAWLQRRFPPERGL